jgi:hypothetical protein
MLIVIFKVLAKVREHFFQLVSITAIINCYFLLKASHTALALLIPYFEEILPPILCTTWYKALFGMAYMSALKPATSQSFTK